MHQEKILNALSSAIGHLENSLKMFSNRKEKETFDLVWRASSDVEYGLFLLSLIHSDEAESFYSKHKLSSQQIETQPEQALMLALEMLREAKDNIKGNDLSGAHEKTWKARSYLLKVQEIFEKKQKASREKSSTPRAS